MSKFVSWLKATFTHDNPTVQAAAATAAKRTLWQGFTGVLTSIAAGIGVTLAGVDLAALGAMTLAAVATALVTALASYFSILANGVPTAYVDVVPDAIITDEDGVDVTGRLKREGVDGVEYLYQDGSQ